MPDPNDNTARNVSGAVSSDMNIKVGISTCLLGENVRYDGTHKLNRYLRDVLGNYVTWVPVCPEVECGLPVPREAMRLVGDPENPRLVTERMLQWSRSRLDALEGEDLCGFVFKTKSPSSGMRGVKVYTDKGMPSHKGVGMFARAFMQRFPEVPVEDDGRLHDDGLRENFIERIFTLARWQALVADGAAAGDLVDFHTRHKLLMMAHSPAHAREMGKIVAEVKRKPSASLLDTYRRSMLEGLARIATVKKHTNVLYHAAGYFKKQLTPDEKKETGEVIESYHGLLTPLIVPVTLINHYVRRYEQAYLSKQYYLNPHPHELTLRNHL